MATTTISVEEAGRDFAKLLARVKAGEEIVIKSADDSRFALRPVSPASRTLSESIALAEARTAERGYEVEMDPSFAADMEEILRNRKPRDTSAWD
jgi:antitoxin (DNA-binding transcriptional repressor) of toxin-antitoxin stability system